MDREFLVSDRQLFLYDCNAETGLSLHHLLLFIFRVVNKNASYSTDLMFRYSKPLNYINIIICIDS